jgi:hypothetical protein
MNALLNRWKKLLYVVILSFVEYIILEIFLALVF